ncbi:MAG TPA: SPOR domain-containing protein [Edaphobacter sp.]|nr:SPOR domain-containing protein [Edaphobacter sp.]
MQTRYETDHDLRDLHEDEQDREISLGTTTILGIFFALALVCAVFFGFGYSLGRRSAQPPISAAEVMTGRESNGSKPASGSLASQTASKQSAATSQTAIVPIDPPAAAAQESQQAPDPTPAKAAVSTPRPNVAAEPSTNTAARPAAVASVAAPASSPGSPVVQVAAMSHQEDADVVAVDLKRRGYTVAIRREPQDKLFHVQIGPLATKKEADAMRQRLQMDGYNNAIVK